RPSDRIAMLRKLVNDRPNGLADQPIDRKRPQAWLKSDLEKNSTLPIFEKLVEKDPAALTLLRSARAESFQFHAFKIPPGGKKVKIGSPATEAGRSNDEPLRE